MKYELELLKQDGYTVRFANRIIDRMNHDIGNFPQDMIEKCHASGFCALSMEHYLNGIPMSQMNRLIESGEYLRDYDYDKLWPLNGWMRIWVNDKLTLKYMLANTPWGGVMPEYYYYTSQDGLRALADNRDKQQSTEAFIATLKEKRSFACKPANGSMAEGFYKLSYKDNEFSINDKICAEQDIIQFLNEHKNYIFTEYLYPETTLAKYSDKVPTIRIMVINRDGNNPYIVPSSYIRFGTVAQGASNYTTSDNGAEYSVFCGVNTETGEFGAAKAFYQYKVENISKHPDTGMDLEGKIPHWMEICEIVKNISGYLFGVEWMGFDICVDFNGKVRIMEINTHPGITYAQVFKPLLSDNYVKDYFEHKINKIASMSEAQKKARNAIQR